MTFTALFAAVLVYFSLVQSTPADDGQLQINRTVVMSGLEESWDLAFAPDGAMLFTEKCRGLSVRTPAGTVRRLFRRDESVCLFKGGALEGVGRLAGGRLPARRAHRASADGCRRHDGRNSHCR